MGHVDPAPEAQGELRDTPFAHLVLYLYRRGDDGTLEIDEGERGKTRIAFRQGRPIAARFSLPVTRIQPGLLRLCGLREGHYDFHSDDRVGSDPSAVRGAVDPYALVSAARERHTRDDVVDGVLQRYARTTLRLQAGRDISRLQLSDEDNVVVDLLRAAPARIDELVAGSPRPARSTRHLLYVLIVTHMITVHEDTASAAQSQVRTRASTPPPRPQETGSDDRMRRPSFQSVNTIAGAQPAWQRLASLRPGASSRPSVVSSRPPVVSSRPPGTSARPPGTSAHPPGTSSSYPPPRSVSPSGRPPTMQPLAPLSPPPPNAPASERFAHAERLYEQGRFEHAAALVEDLIRERGDFAAYHGFKALALFRMTRESDSSLPREVVDVTRHALRLDEDEPRALLARGLILKRAGDLRRALVSFQRAARSDPTSLEIKRELQLARRRLGKPER